MNLLIDTHVALWWFDDPSQVSQEGRDTVGNLKNRVYFSAVSAWEIAIKRRLGKLQAPPDLSRVLAANYFEPLAITLEDALRVESLPVHHRDPFDRLLIAQALEHGFTLVSRDIAFSRYEVDLIRG